jgi:DmsE family decaheme c-type cytochrome
MRIGSVAQARSRYRSIESTLPFLLSGPSWISRAAAVGLLLGLASAIAPPAHALEAISIAAINRAIRFSDAAAPAAEASTTEDAAVAALRDYAESLAPGETAAAAAPADAHDDLAALREYARSLGDDTSAARHAPVRLAEADTLIDALRQMLHKDDADQAAPAPAPAPARPVKAAPVVEATYVGAKVCLTCHAAQAATFAETLMGRIGKTHQGKFDCENCHGPGSAHVRAGGGRGVGGIISFRANDPNHTAAENNAICLNCHERGDRTYWSGSTHETRGLQCTDCHTVMRNVSAKHNLKTAWELDTCFQCHKDRRAQLYRTGHMPLREGKMVCSDCHNPHGSMTEAMLRGDSINDTCYKCHAEKRGPFLFEHLPVRENCVNCHDPHGSVNEAMLKMSKPRLCGECHTFDHGPTINGGPLNVMGFGRACLNCHTQIHGTNSPSGALLLR